LTSLVSLSLSLPPPTPPFSLPHTLSVISLSLSPVSLCHFLSRTRACVDGWDVAKLGALAVGRDGAVPGSWDSIFVDIGMLYLQY